MLALVALLVVSAPAPAPEPLVDVTDKIPDAVLDIRYATENNFMKKRVYPVARCLLRESVAARLAKAAESLRAKGFRLRLHDCYRPQSVQYEMWKAFPKKGWVADPKTGSNHNRGAAIDLSLVTKDGAEVEMPTEYDAFDPKALSGATEGISKAALKNRGTLREAMEAQGFKAEPKEWWHFNAPEPKKFPLSDDPLEKKKEGAAKPD